jgi:hypothetical protein
MNDFFKLRYTDLRYRFLIQLILSNINMTDNIDIKDFIKNRLDNLDNSNEKYSDLINNSNIKFELDDNVNFIKFYDDKQKEIYKGKITILGTLDLDSKVWLWAWVTPNFTIEQSKDSRDILKYALELEPNSNSSVHFYIKSHFVNSRIYFDSDITFDIHLALSFYITKKAKFIYPRITKNLEGTNLIVYYLVF